MAPTAKWTLKTQNGYNPVKFQDIVLKFDLIVVKSHSQPKHQELLIVIVQYLVQNLHHLVFKFILFVC